MAHISRYTVTTLRATIPQNSFLYISAFHLDIVPPVFYLYPITVPTTPIVLITSIARKT